MIASPLLLVLALAAGPSLTAPAPTPEPIIGGDAAEAGEFDMVVAFVSPAGGICTGTVVAPRLVLTAAHCLKGWRQSDAFDVFYGPSLESHPSTTTVGFGVHPQYCEECGKNGEEDIHDYGYLELGADFMVPGGFIAPIVTQDEWDAAMRPGREVTLVGYGTDEIDGKGGEGVKRIVTSTIRRLSDEGLEFYAGGDQQDTCDGDSGGPAFVRVDGQWRLAGITSRGTTPCGQGGYYGVPYAALSWIRDETGVALGDPDCPTDDCIDTAPPPDGACAIDPRRLDAAWWLMVLLAMRRRRPRS